MGFNFKSTLALQVQSKTIVRNATSSRLTTTFDEEGNLNISGRPATVEEKIARRLSARETSGARSADVVQVGDYSVLPESLQDLYLTGSHGLSSLYPSIILTTPRTSKIIDINSNLTTTPFVIDINNQVKKTIERNISDLISQNQENLQLTTAQYNQNIQIAKQYADACLQTATSKDRLISLLNIASIDPQQNSGFITSPLIGNNYVFLQGKRSVIEYLKNLDTSEGPNYKTDVLEKGTHTQAIAQLLKTLYFYYLFGDLSINPTQSFSIISDGVIDGYLGDFYVSAIRDLRKIKPITRDGVKKVFLYNDGDASIDFNLFRGSFEIADLVRLISRDMQVISMKDRLLDVAVNNQVSLDATNTALGIIGDLTSRYAQIKNYSEGLVMNDRDVVPKGNVNVDEIIDQVRDTGQFASAATRSTQKFRDALVGIDEQSKPYGKLDLGEGTNRLIYNSLLDAAASPDFSELQTTINKYRLYTNSIFVAIRDSFPGQEILIKKIQDYFLSFITGSGINTSAVSSNASAARIITFIMAANNDKIKARLFRLLCAIDKNIVEGEDNQSEIDDAAVALYNADESNEPDTGGDIYKKDVTLHSSLTKISGAQAKFEDRYGTFNTFGNITPDDNTSYRTFHKIAREALAGYASSVQLGRTGTAPFDFGLGLSVDAYAFVIYSLFLNVLRKMHMTASVQINRDDAVYIVYSFSWYPDQFKALAYAIENATVDPVVLEAGLNFTSNTTTFKDNAKVLHSEFFNSIVQRINHQKQVCYDITNILYNHGTQLMTQAQDFTTKVSNVMNLMNSAGLQGRETLLNAIQSEQAFLKKHIVDRYSKPLRGASYLPSAIDHNSGQALNVKTVVSTLPILNDPSNNAVTRKFLIAVGMPTGLLENLRYQNTLSGNEHLFSIDLIFRNLQVSQSFEELQIPLIKSYKFSSRIFVDEGSQLTNGADVNALQLSNYQQIYNATKYKVVDDSGNYRDVLPSQLERTMPYDDVISDVSSGKSIINNHLISHYSKLLLKTTSGVTIDEEIFDLVPQTRKYPDNSQIANYTTLVDLMTVKYPDTPEGRLNRERAMRDLSRASLLSPEQHKISMMSSKLFERIHVIPVDIEEIRAYFQLGEDDISFIDVVARIRIEDVQTPVQFEDETPRRSVVQDVAEQFRQTSAADQSVSSVGINSAIEASQRFGGSFRR